MHHFLAAYVSYSTAPAHLRPFHSIFGLAMRCFASHTPAHVLDSLCGIFSPGLTACGAPVCPNSSIVLSHGFIRIHIPLMPHTLRTLWSTWRSRHAHYLGAAGWWKRCLVPSLSCGLGMCCTVKWQSSVLAMSASRLQTSITHQTWYNENSWLLGSLETSCPNPLSFWHLEWTSTFEQMT